jgi:tRNA-dihydrouridine synthase
VPDSPKTMADYIAGHYEDMLTLYGVESGLRQARKHLGWYLDRHAAGVTDDRRKAILTTFEPARVIALLREVFFGEGEAAPLRSAA